MDFSPGQIGAIILWAAGMYFGWRYLLAMPKHLEEWRQSRRMLERAAGSARDSFRHQHKCLSMALLFLTFTFGLIALDCTYIGLEFAVKLTGQVISLF